MQRSASHVTTSISSCIVESQALSSLGMPEDVYTQIFDGEPTAHGSYAVFQAVKYHAVQQRLTECEYERMHQVQLPPAHEQGVRAGYLYEGFPQAVKGILRGDYFIKCNFPTRVS
jgi:hypothetical protein